MFTTQTNCCSTVHQSLLDIRERGTGKKIAQFASDLYRPWSAYGVSQDGKYLAAADNQAIRVWEVATRRQITRIPNNENVKSLAISPDGKYLVSGSGFPFNKEGATARIWELSTSKQRIELKHDNLVVAAAFSQDGKYVAPATCTYSKETNPVSCIDSQVRVWDVRTGSDVIRLVVGQRVRRLAYPPHLHHSDIPYIDTAYRPFPEPGWMTSERKSGVQARDEDIAGHDQAHCSRRNPICAGPADRRVHRCLFSSSM